MVYLLIGQDAQARETQLKKIKQEFLPKELQDFNLDTLYAKEISLKDLQERCLAIPLKNARRIIVIKGADCLNNACRSFILGRPSQADKHLVMVLVFERYDYQDDFIKGLSRYAKVMRFREAVKPDTFALNRQIELRNSDSALRILGQLLKNGEAPERILGGLRYAWEKQGVRNLTARRKLKMLLGCDVEIKTGRLKAALALEKLVVGLCGFTQASH
ncbi:MAG: hypothetical protein PHW98_00885 [Candidatus Omnitrophica bacterium]|nr:hypothetical protein [Candidatus Omnitrophota bacterium]